MFHRLRLSCLLLVFVLTQTLALAHASTHDLSDHRDTKPCELCDYHASKFHQAVIHTVIGASLPTAPLPVAAIPASPLSSLPLPFAARAPPVFL